MKAVGKTLWIMVVAGMAVMISAGCESKRVRKGAIPASRPATSKPASGNKPIQIELRAVGRNHEGVVFIFDGKGYSRPEELGKALAPIGKQDPDTPVVIAPEDRVLWKHVGDAFNECLKAGLHNVGFAPKEAANSGDSK